MIPPAIIRVRIADEYGKRFGLWLPMFLLWPFALAVFLVLLPFLIIAEVVLTLVGAGFHPLLAMLGLFGLISALRGTRVDVASPGSRKQVKVYIN
jgi:hypothetical protein